MRCPKCGSPMNRHAEKPLKTPGHEEAEMVAAIHCCPACGDIEEEIKPLND